MVELLDEVEILKLELLVEGLYCLDNGVLVLFGGKNKEIGKIVFLMFLGVEVECYDVVILKCVGKFWFWIV